MPPGSKSAGIRRSAPGYGIGNPHAVGVVVGEPKEVKTSEQDQTYCIDNTCVPLVDSETVRDCGAPNRRQGLPVSGQELENRTRYLIVPLVQGEMPSVEQMDLGFPKITFEPFSPRSDERWIVPSSDYQGR